MSEVYVKTMKKTKKKGLTLAKAPVNVRTKKGGGYVVSQAFVKGGATNPIPKLHVKRGDTVMVISGKEKGKKGKVLVALPKKGKVVVEGINIIKKHSKPKGMGRSGEIIEKEAPIFASKVMLMDTTKDKPTRIGHKTLKNGKRVRVSKVSGEQID